MCGSIGDQKGSILVIFALILVVLVGFTALGIEAGQWYLTQAELSKAVDAAALACAANLSNPNVTAATLAKDFGAQNFMNGYLGTPTSGNGAVTFTAAQSGDQVTVTGQTNANALLTSIFGINNVAVNSVGAAVMNHVQIMLVLDNSGSMAGTPISDLKSAVNTFMSYFQDTEVQAVNKIGLVSFATNVTLDCPLEYNYYTAIVNATSGLQANGATNSEDALYQAGQQLPDQSQAAAADRIPQFMIFFTDGRPTAFTSTFKNNGTSSSAVLASSGNCDSNSDSLYGLADPSTGNFSVSYSAVPTGDGLSTGATVCKSSPKKGQPLQGYLNTRWGSFASYPISSLGAEAYPAYCSVNTSLLNGQNGYLCQTARQMAIDNVTALKNRYVVVYAIGLGSSINQTFLGEISSGSDYLFIAPDSTQLQSIFSAIAQDIKLRMVK